MNFLQYVVTLSQLCGLAWMYQKSLNAHDIVVSLPIYRFSVADLVVVFCVLATAMFNLKHNGIKVCVFVTMVFITYLTTLLAIGVIQFVTRLKLSFWDMTALVFFGFQISAPQLTIVVPLISSMVVFTDAWVSYNRKRPTHKLVIESFNRRRHGVRCVICYKKLRNRVAGLHTRHIHYHVKCLKTWIRYGHVPTCPNCRFTPNIAGV